MGVPWLPLWRGVSIHNADPGTSTDSLNDEITLSRGNNWRFLGKGEFAYIFVSCALNISPVRFIAVSICLNLMARICAVSHRETKGITCGAISGLATQSCFQ